MEPTRDFSAQKVNNPTEHVMTIEEFREKYQDPKIVAEFKRLGDAIVQHEKELDSLLLSTDKLLKELGIDESESEDDDDSK